MTEFPEENEVDVAQEEREEKAPFVPSPVSRRIWAWMGVVYVVIICLLMTYWIANMTYITGITGIMLFPALGALSAQGFNNAYRCRHGLRGGNFTLLFVSAVVMGLIALMCLAWGAGELVAVFGG